MFGSLPPSEVGSDVVPQFATSCMLKEKVDGVVCFIELNEVHNVRTAGRENCPMFPTAEAGFVNNLCRKRYFTIQWLLHLNYNMLQIV